MTDAIKKMDAKTFREQGFLRELNRNWLHPMGLALETKVHEDGSETFGEVWDYRDDAEGMAFADSAMATDQAVEQAAYVEQLRQSKLEARKELFGWTVQPVGKKEE